MRKIYVDVDDTLGDFKAHCVARGVPAWDGSWYTTDPATWTDEQHAIQKATTDQMECDDFWKTMPVAEGAFELLAACGARGEVHLLTALPRSITCSILRANITFDKIHWCSSALHFPMRRVVVCERHEKPLYALGERWWTGERYDNVRNVLVDDAVQNCKEWAAGGGHAVLHENMVETIAAVKRL